MSKLKSKIDYKAIDKNAFDSPLINRCFTDEYGQCGKPTSPKDFINWKKLATINKDGVVKPLVFRKPKPKKK